MANDFDTSALCRHDHREPGSDKVKRVLAEAGFTHCVSWLTLLETQSAFALTVRTGEITKSDLKPLRARLRTDISARRLLVIRVLRRHYDRAEKLLAKYGPTLRLRSLDALHLAMALDLRDRGMAQTLVSADATMVNVGTLEGIAIINLFSVTDI